MSNIFSSVLHRAPWEFRHLWGWLPELGNWKPSTTSSLAPPWLWKTKGGIRIYSLPTGVARYLVMVMATTPCSAAKSPMGEYIVHRWNFCLAKTVTFTWLNQHSPFVVLNKEISQYQELIFTLSFFFFFNDNAINFRLLLGYTSLKNTTAVRIVSGWRSMQTCDFRQQMQQFFLKMYIDTTSFQGCSNVLCMLPMMVTPCKPPPPKKQKQHTSIRSSMPRPIRYQEQYVNRKFWR